MGKGFSGCFGVSFHGTAWNGLRGEVTSREDFAVPFTADSSSGPSPPPHESCEVADRAGPAARGNVAWACILRRVFWMVRRGFSVSEVVLTVYQVVLEVF